MIKKGGGLCGEEGGDHIHTDWTIIKTNQCVEKVQALYGGAEDERRVRTVGLAASSDNLAAKYAGYVI